MVRVYKRKEGARNYRNGYTANDLTSALDQIVSGKIGVRNASKRYGIPIGTLHNRLKGTHKKKVGGQYRLTEDCETEILLVINALCEWKSPLTKCDVRLLAKNCLDRRGVVDAAFKDNFPGIDWLNAFTKRHQLTKHLADNITSPKSKISFDSINKYFDNLIISMEGISLSNCFNCSEINVTGDPGARKVITRRGVRLVEQNAEHSKQSFNVMFCGNALGEYLPPMVIYRGHSCYLAWTEGGPIGALYDATPSGWFDSRTFEIWFQKLFLPAVVEKPGPKLIIGNNISSYFSGQIVKKALDNNIRFVTPPPKTTHLCQPLDVAVFESAKHVWENILEKWREETNSKGSIPKNQFPNLLKHLCDNLPAANLVSGFRSCGIFPTDRNEVLKLLPGAM